MKKKETIDARICVEFAMPEKSLAQLALAEARDAVCLMPSEKKGRKANGVLEQCGPLILLIRHRERGNGALR